MAGTEPQLAAARSALTPCCRKKNRRGKISWERKCEEVAWKYFHSSGINTADFINWRA